MATPEYDIQQCVRRLEDQHGRKVCRIVRVCKDWYSIGIPFLYEHILRACPNIHTVCIANVCYRPDARSPWTSYQAARYLQTCSTGPYYHPCHTTAATASSLSASLCCTSNILTTEVFDALPSTLEFFDCTGDDDLAYYLSPNTWCSFLTSHPNLRFTVLLSLNYDEFPQALALSPLLPFHQLNGLSVYPSQFFVDRLPALHSVQRLGLN
ncbi:hypothetical protein BKA70DRAFT_43268 [Coprinopsis sp. MPI-PUGE-AT-0042]|nr:hypothetical protein BKA70DRAFT_43268 [Coprinopsis sp. MPI-PUGE-AT-0042]